MIRRPPRSTHCISSAASDVYKRQEYISTRWYRSPECLLTDGYYNYKMDLWGTGCVFFEVLSLFPLFPGNDELDQINKIHDIMGLSLIHICRCRRAI
eukprot:TRINITY_DN1152_c0_g2_i1.p2 TRINITY_DN1152_c0_g2~~TRINITY_DN1152_c0_g2_i1.p2  ORF type:complete len:104 (-),score=40.50 TRINITY_DN1152_c0_g2_i1:51-341(-)